MATHKTAIISFDRLIKIGIWSNQEAKTTLSAVYSQLKKQYPDKEIYIANGGFFNMDSTLKPCFGLKANGKVYADNWNMYFMGMNGKTIKFGYGSKDVASYTDLVSGSPPLVENGKKSKYFTYCIDNSNRGRTMLGYNQNSVILSCIADVSGTTDFTLDEEVDYMLKMQCTHAINLDGGGSTQCNFNGETITSSRKVSNFVYIIAEPVKQPNNTNTSTTVTTYGVGDKIKIQAGATYTTGKKIPTWVLNSTLYCRAINNDNTVTFSILKVGPVTGAVSNRYVTGTTVVSSQTDTNTSNVPPVSNEPASFKVKVTASILNIRNGYNTAYTCVGKAYKDEIYEIEETRNNWGRIKGTQNWFCLNYTQKI